MEGLEGAGAGAKLDRQAMDRTLVGLGKRRFLLHNVHEDHAVVLTTRWVMSYLAGPFTREQIKRLMADQAGPAQPGVRTDPGPVVGNDISAQDRPPLPPGILQVFLPPRQALPEAAEVVYYPCLLGAAQVAYHSTRHKVAVSRDIVVSLEVGEGPVPVGTAILATVMGRKRTPASGAGGAPGVRNLPRGISEFTS